MSAAAILQQLQQAGIQPQRLCLDSRKLQPGDVFLAVPGAAVDGRRFIVQVAAAGAAAIVCEAAGLDENSLPATLSVPLLRVSGLAGLMGELASLVYGQPSLALNMIGITGTNGKTSVSQWCAQALNALGQRCAVIGTLGNGFLGELDSSANTTPDAVTLQSALASYVQRGAQACAMEVSSIGLEQGRINGVNISVAVLTNFTRDHLDYHGTMEAYAEAKVALFHREGVETVVLNLDDALGRQVAAAVLARPRRPKVIGYTLSQPVPALAAQVDELLQPEAWRMVGAGLQLTLSGHVLQTALVGRFNAENLLAVLGVLRALGYELADCLSVLAQLQPPPGRMEVLGGKNQPLVVVDYAHTPDALEKALQALRETAHARGGKLLCVFGCGGDRDPGKRPQMGALAAKLADVAIVTSDNPRSENPVLILEQIRAGMAQDAILELDRRTAIHNAIDNAAVADVVLIAGKGHEPYQEIAGVRHPFSDVSEARLALESRI